MDGIALSFDDDALDYIVDKAVEYRLGARGLRSICEAVMMDSMFELPSRKNSKRASPSRSTTPEARSTTRSSAGSRP